MPSDSTAIVVASISGAVAVAVAVRGELERRKLALSQEEHAKHLQERQAAQAMELQEARLRADAANARVAEEASLRAQEEKLRMEMRTEFMAEEAIRALLRHERWAQRSFEEIKNRVRGFPDEELRQLLVRAGAVAFTGTRGSNKGKELWGLRERNPQDL